jgi:putative cell wall-binding protein
MPLTNNVIIKLNEITTIIEDKNNLRDSEIDAIKKIFQRIIEDGERYDLDDIESWFENEGSWTNIIEDGERYDLDDIESWFENEGSWTNKASKIRITNLAHYVQNKSQQTLKLKIISDDDCDC